MKILSLFDGISCGRLALKRAGIDVEKYDAYEIDKYAIKISENNWNDINHKGDVIAAKYDTDYDLLIGGSPCQSLSSSNVWLKEGEYGVTGDGKSRLFWEYMRAYLTVKPKWFIFENVASMKNVDRDIITEQLGVEPVKIDSQLFSAQKRNRYYWTNIPFKTPAERLVNTTLQDILEPDLEIDPKYHLTQKMLDCVLSPPTGGWVSRNNDIDLTIARPITATCWKMHRADADNYVTSSVTPAGKTNVRRLTPVECERLQTLPDNYTEGVSNTRRYETIGNGWTVDVITYILKTLSI